MFYHLWAEAKKIFPPLTFAAQNFFITLDGEIYVSKYYFMALRWMGITFSPPNFFSKYLL
jgi:hypothetical protein